MVRRSTLILIGVFAVLIVVMLLLQRLPADETPDLADFPTSAPIVNLFDFGSQTVVGLSVRNLDGNQVAMQLENEQWQLESAAAGETDSQRVANAVAQIASMRVLNDAPIQAGLATIGLDFPRYDVTLTLSDGGVHEIAVGNASVTSTGYYVIVDGGEPQLVTKSTLDQLIGLLNDPPRLPTPTPEPESEATPEVLETDAP